MQLYLRLGLDADGSVMHPILVTVTVAQPNMCRHLYNQLLFELYGVPSVGYGIDSLFSLHYNIPDIKDALVLSLGRLFELQSKNNSENL